MKISKLFGILICAIMVLFFSSCKGPNYVDFEKISLAEYKEGFSQGASKIADLIPDYYSDCRIIIETEEDLNIEEYKRTAYESIDNFKRYEEYNYLSYWNENSGILITYPFKNAKIDIVTLSNTSKVLSLEIQDGHTTKFNVYKDNKPVLEINGEIDYCGERCLYFLAGELKLYDKDEFYLKEEYKTEGYVENCKEYKEIFTKYYPTGVRKYQKVQLKEYDETADPYEGGISAYYTTRVLEEKDYREDGTLIPLGYVDLGLPSGTLWKDSNEGGKNALYTYKQAISKFGNKLPTKEQLEELSKRCTWHKRGDGYKVVGPNGNSIYLPAAGRRLTNGKVEKEGSEGKYWSSTSKGSNQAYLLNFNRVFISNFYDYQVYGLSVRLVMEN